MRHLRLLVPAFALALAVSACGGGEDDGSADDGNGTGAELTQAERALAFNECMREQGIDMPDPDPDQPAIAIPDRDDPAVQEALEVCREEMPGGGPFGGGEPDAEQLAALQEFTECMREEGIDMPDPNPDGSLSLPEGMDTGDGPQMGPGGGGRVDAEFQAAIEECQHLLQGAPVRMGPGPGGGQ